MFKNSEITTLNIANTLTMPDLFDWLPHDNAIIMIKDVLSINALWGKVLVDNTKIRQSQFFENFQTIPIEYSLELIAQSLGVIGAAQSVHNLVKREKAEQAFITGAKNLKFHVPSFSLDFPLYIESTETKAIENFKFCEVHFYSLPKDKKPISLTTGILKTYAVSKK